MAKSANLYARIEPEVKEQADTAHLLLCPQKPSEELQVKSCGET